MLFRSLQSLDLEYHNLNPAQGLYHALVAEGRAERLISDQRIEFCTTTPPANTRAQARGLAVQHLQSLNTNYVINWDSIRIGDKDPLIMGNPFHPYGAEIRQLLADAPPAS